MSPRRRRPIVALAAVLASIALASVAQGNGRPPYTNGVYFQPANNQLIVVRSTFGLLISTDGGCSFRWTCEDSIGYGGTFDPAYQLAADGTLYATTLDGMRVSHDGGCTFESEFPGHYVEGLDIGSDGAVWISTADSAGSNNILRSVDGGATFTPAGLMSPVALWNGVRVAPSDAAHVYATGYQLAAGSAAAEAHFFSTTDGGSNWTESALTGVQFAETPDVTVAAIDPADPQTVFLVSTGAHPPGDLLYRSTDGGATFAQVLVTPQPLVGLVIADAKTVIAAYGTNEAGGGAARSVDGGATFTPLATAPQLVCLGKRPDGTLVGCGANWDPDFMAVATSADNGATWTKMFRFVELDGVLACPAGTVDHDDCEAQQWPTIRDQFGVTGPACPSATDVVPIDAAGSGVADTGGRSGGCGAGDGSPIGLAALGLLIAWAIGARVTRRRAT